MKIKLIDIASVIRSKNAGPYELTLDIIFKSRTWYETVVDKALINAALICRLYQIPPEDIINIIQFAPAGAIKVTIRRQKISGAIGETDVYGAQQHAPLLGVEFGDIC